MRKPPYYAVIFSSVLREDAKEYGETADRMVELAAGMPGYLGIESARGADGFGITVSYWETEADIARWKREAEHRIAQDRGRSEWYLRYDLRVAKVERAYGMPTPTLEP